MGDGRPGVEGGVWFVVSCEHAGTEVPAAYASCFSGAEAREALASHRGWDPGSLELGEGLARALGAPVVVQRVSRLVVECNRSLDHPQLWSEFTRSLPAEEKAGILFRHWLAHRDAVREAIASGPADAMVVHVGAHTFSPVWEGRRRSTDIGLLYDPEREGEARVARRWLAGLEAQLGPQELGIHLNRPYQGWTDGLTTTLRGELPSDRYLGFELEVSQGRVPIPDEMIGVLARTLAGSVEAYLGRGPSS